MVQSKLRQVSPFKKFCRLCVKIDLDLKWVLALILNDLTFLQHLWLLPWHRKLEFHQYCTVSGSYTSLWQSVRPLPGWLSAVVQPARNQINTFLQDSSKKLRQNFLTKETSDIKKIKAFYITHTACIEFSFSTSFCHWNILKLKCLYSIAKLFEHYCTISCCWRKLIWELLL